MGDALGVGCGDEKEPVCAGCSIFVMGCRTAYAELCRLLGNLGGRRSNIGNRVAQRGPRTDTGVTGVVGRAFRASPGRYAALSARTVSPRALTSAKPPWIAIVSGCAPCVR